ncbi:hypothetical protein N9H39_00070 [Gammaproteobacteria bacterium]|jgi:hypothetical protein|nr:hypothetical protein [Gammaproteobacteria bacterium]MDB4272275.1 hypothetical protein [bacterium]|tara:strand:- start:897 stop:1106 length:210 start_codon:yes stop_codon:yes gene_type:complete
MGILDKLQSAGSVYSRDNGATPVTPRFADSTLHKEYSITGAPAVLGKPSPSQLDLNGSSPDKYIDNLPE